MEVLGTLVLSLPRISPLRIGTSHEGLRDFGSEFTKDTPPHPEFGLLMEVLGTLVLSLPRTTPPPPSENWNFSWRNYVFQFWAYQWYPIPIQDLVYLWRNKGCQSWAYQEKLPRIGTSMEDFSSELTINTQSPPTQGLGLLMEDLGTLVLSWPRIAPPSELELLMEDCAGDWCVETNRCIPADTVSFNTSS